MTTAIFAESAAPNAARVALRLPSGRTLALLASFALHAGIAYFCQQHATRERIAVARADPALPVLEISLAPVSEPAPNVEAAPRTTPMPAARAALSARSVSNAAASAATAQMVSRATAASEPTVAPNGAAVDSPVPSASAASDASAASAASADARGEAQAIAPRFILRAPAVVAVGAQVPRGAGASAPSAAAPFPEAAVDTPAKLQAGSPPSYTRAAEAAGVEAELPLEVVIDAGGAVQSARALEHVGYGLDEAALTAVRRYRFTAARRAGTAVAVRMRWVLRFQLR